MCDVRAVVVLVPRRAAGMKGTVGGVQTESTRALDVSFLSGDFFETGDDHVLGEPTGLRDDLSGSSKRDCCEQVNWTGQKWFVSSRKWMLESRVQIHGNIDVRVEDFHGKTSLGRAG